MAFVALLLIAALMMRLFPYIEAWQRVKRLPTIHDPHVFIQEFEPEGKTSVELQIYTPGLGMDGGRLIRSPLLPYTELTTQSIVQQKCTTTYSTRQRDTSGIAGRYLNIDRFWNVFWVEIDICGERTAFYGPYRVSALL